MTCQFCENLIFGKRKTCWRYECKRLRDKQVRAYAAKPMLFTGKSYREILIDNLERKYPGHGKEKAQEVLKQSRIINSWGGGAWR